VTVRRLPGICTVSTVTPPAHFARTRLLTSDGNDDISLFVNTAGGTTVRRGCEMTFRAGEAFFVSMAEPVSFAAPPQAARVHCFHIHVPRVVLAPLIADLDDALTRRIAPNCEALRYLQSYVRFMQHDEAALTEPGVARTAAQHLQDLLALVLGASRDAAVVAEGRGLLAARLREMMDYVARHSADRDLTVGSLAARYGLSPRYVQRLFETDGTTFTGYLLNQRLARARSMLADPVCSRLSVSAIALEAGFGDISYFNRRFRRRFGESPTQARTARREY
jgi:AraC-like DNA-binding protein